MSVHHNLQCRCLGTVPSLFLHVKIRLSVLLFCILLLSTVSSSLAQQVTPVSPQSNPALIIQEVEVSPEKKVDPIGDKKEIKQEPEPFELELDEAPDTQELDDPNQFNVSIILIEGSKIYPDNHFDAILSRYQGRKLSLNDLEKAAKDIQQVFYDDGYVTTKVFLPPQDVENETITLQVIEGHLGVVELADYKYYRPSVIAKHLDLHRGDVFNVQELEKTINQLHRFQHYRLKAVLESGANAGETDITFKVKEQQPWQISATWDNQGRPNVGTYRYGVAVTNNNVLGFGDRLSLQWLGAYNTTIAATSYSFPVNRYGTEITYNYSYSYVDVDLAQSSPLQQSLIEGFSNSHSMMVSQPLDKNRIATLDMAFNAKRTSTQLNQVQVNQDDVRSLTWGLNLNKSDRYGRTFSRLQTDVGIDGWLSSNKKFWKASVQGGRVQMLPLGMMMIVRANAQFTPDGLPPVEQFQLGGAQSVRGYTEGLLSGDRGYSVSSEVRWPIPGLKKISPTLDKKLQGAVFADFGQVFTDESSTQFRGGFSNTSANSILIGSGVGIRAQLSRFLTGFADFGFGLIQNAPEANAQPTVRFHFGVRSDMLSTEYKKRSDNTYVVSQ